jgi:predicted KAP-like P-loop ATPase
MYSSDKPIKFSKDDYLSRAEFSQKLAESILSWEGKEESLVVSICGKWGYGKSSVINLMKEWLKISNGETEVTVFEFNPWIFSGEGDLSKYFFEELAKELSTNATKKDEEIAKKLRLYSRLLDLIPEKSGYSFIKDLFLIIGLFGISASNFIEILNVQPESLSLIKNTVFILGFVFIIISFSKDFIKKLADYFDGKWELENTSVSSLKEDLSKNLKERDKKLLVIIDDIDRLSQSEMKHIFKLVKMNTDFPNTIYVLSFDAKIVKDNLNEQAGVSGKDYLDKIVQINFDIPHLRQHKINEILFQELDKILSTLPSSHNNYFNQEYWTNIYHSGFKNFFQSIRDIKRFSNSLEFNISLMHKGDSMEVNPIDFMAIESIRVFCPDFYYFMRSKNTLFTDIKDREQSEKQKRKEEIEKALDKVDSNYQNNLKSLLFVLFPQISTVYENTSYGYEWQSIWNKQLRVCATSYFDAYFTLIPGGAEEELSQYELDSILKQMSNSEQLENSLLELIKDKKIRKVLERLQDYTDDENQISIKYAQSIVQALFNISDLLPSEKKGMWDFGADMDVMRIMHQILRRQKEITKNYEIFKNTIPLSKGLSGPVLRISLESSQEKEVKRLVPVETLKELQILCVNKIKKLKEEGNLIDNKNFVEILYRWKEWDTSKEWESYIKDLMNTDEGLLIFIDKFISETYSYTFGNYGYRLIRKFDYESLNSFVNLEFIKLRLDKIKQINVVQYESKKEAIDLFLSNYDINCLNKESSGSLDS